ncbi:MAG: hypothetical protein V3V31_00370 [Methylococcales bacterium]
MKKYIYICTVIVLAACSPQPNAPGTKYDYQSKVADLKPSLWQKDKDTALAKAKAKVRKYANSECRTIDYGWTLNELKNPGETRCEERADGKFRCQLAQVEMECRRLSPGSVGMGPFSKIL